MDDQKKLTIDRFTVLAHKRPPMPIQPAPLSWMGNEYWLNGSDNLQLESKGRYGLFDCIICLDGK